MTDEQRKAVGVAQQLVLNMGAVTSCLNCEHWDKAEDKCGQYNMKPPAQIIYFGCEKWEFNIPF